MRAVLRGTLQARQLIKAEKPDAILGMGGFTSVPVVLAGLFSRVPCFLHEQNVSPGLANRLLARRVKAVFVSFAETARYLKARQVVHTGNPIRKTMRGKREAKPAADFSVFVFGGSRGARSVNNAALELLPYLEAYGHTAIYHQTGGEDFDRIRAGYKASGAASRGLSLHGSIWSTTTTLPMSSFPGRALPRSSSSPTSGSRPSSSPIPLQRARHQWKNASYVESMGGGRVIANSEVSGERLYRRNHGFEGKPGGARGAWESESGLFM